MITTVLTDVLKCALVDSYVNCWSCTNWSLAPVVAQNRLFRMENIKVIAANHGKVTLREMNLSQGGNNVRWLNDREERLLQTSLHSMEKAHKRALSRLQTEVKDLHHTLREQATIRSPLLTKETYLLDKDVLEWKRPATAVNTKTFKLHDESLAQNKTEEATRGPAGEVKDSPLEHITLEGELTWTTFLQAY